MLFDLEDYRTNGITGKDHKPANEVNWVDAYTTARATRDAYLKAVNEYYLSSSAFVSIEEKKALDLDFVAYLDSFRIFNPLMKQFFNGMISLPLVGLNVGDKFDVIEVNKNDNNPNYISYEVPLPSWYSTDNHYVAVLSETGEYTFTEMNQGLYDSYKAAMEDFQGKVKNIILTAEGIESFEDYVAPVVPVWNSYPELSGYVRGTNNLTIKDAVVRLVDLDGTNHDIVTDANGYYKFSKEMFYNSIAFNHSATASSVNMFVLSQKVGGLGHMSHHESAIYDKTNIFQSSFFGAENSRSLTWEVSIKMGKQARRNFKLDFIPDYSNFPSFSGHVLDQNGNPVQNALVSIKDPNSGYAIGQRIVTNPNTGEVSYKYDKKYDFFGIERTILTDINGYYEYPSQMVGEWFNKYGFNLGIPTDVFTNPQLTQNQDNDSNFTYSNQFMVILIPYVQNPLTDVIEWDSPAVRIYDNHDWFNSRFQYALNDQNLFSYTTIEMGQSYVIDVQETLVDAEVGAERLYFSFYKGNFAATLKTTTGYARLKLPDGTYQLAGYGDPNSTFAIGSYIDGNNDVDNIFYVYSCEGTHGAASGFIKSIEIDNLNANLDVTRLTNLESLYIYEGHSSYLDLTSNTTLKNLTLNNNHLMTVDGISGLVNLESLSVNGPVNTGITRSTTEFTYELPEEKLHHQYYTPGLKNYIDGTVWAGAKAGDKYFVAGMFNSYNIRDKAANQISNYQSRGLIKFNSDDTIDTTFNIGSGFDGSPNDLYAFSNQKVLVAGGFSSLNDQSVNKLIKLNPSGLIDNSFNSGITDGNVYQIKVLSNGKIAVLGWFYIQSISEWTGLVLLNEDGSLFSNITNINGGNYGPGSFYINLQSDDKIILVSNGTLQRFNSDGTLDNTFAYFAEGIASPCSVSVQSDDKILITYVSNNGTFTIGDNTIKYFTRLNADGSLDIAFNESFTSAFVLDYVPGFIKELSNGNIVVQGQFNSVSSSRNWINCLVLDNNGIEIPNQVLFTAAWWGTNISQILELGNDLLIMGENNLEFYQDGGLYDIWTGPLFRLKKVGNPTFLFDFPNSNYLTSIDNFNTWGFSGGDLNLSTMPSLTSINTYVGDRMTSIDLSGLTSISSLSLNGCAGISSLDISELTSLSSLTLSSWPAGKGFDNPDFQLITNDTIYNNLTYFNGNSLYSQLNAPNLTNLTLVGGTGVLDLSNNDTIINLNIGGSNGYSYTSIDLSNCNSLSSLGLNLIDTLENLNLDGSTIRTINIVSVRNENFDISGSFTTNDLTIADVPVLTSLNITSIATNETETTGRGIYIANSNYLTDLTINGYFNSLYVDNCPSLTNFSATGKIKYRADFFQTTCLSTLNVSTWDVGERFWLSQYSDGINSNGLGLVTPALMDLDFSGMISTKEIMVNGYKTNSPILSNNNSAQFVIFDYYGVVSTDKNSGHYYDLSTDPSQKVNIDSVYNALIAAGHYGQGYNYQTGHYVGFVSGYNTTSDANLRATLLNRGWVISSTGN